MGRPFFCSASYQVSNRLQEDPLRPLEVVRVGGIDLAVPVVAEAEHLDLPAEGVDVLLRGDARVRAGLDGVLLGGQAEGVPAHRVQDVEAAHALVAGQDVGGGVAFGMADVQAGAAGVGEHVEDVELRLVRTGPVRRAEGLVRLPELLPARLDRRGVVSSAWSAACVGRGKWFFWLMRGVAVQLRPVACSRVPTERRAEQVQWRSIRPRS